MNDKKAVFTLSSDVSPSDQLTGQVIITNGEAQIVMCQADAASSNRTGILGVALERGRTGDNAWVFQNATHQENMARLILTMCDGLCR